MPRTVKPATRARQDYVKALYALGGDRSVVSTSRLATRLGVSAPSATNMLRQLDRDGLALLSPGKGARLSARGRRMALEMVRRHRILESFLVRILGLDWSVVHEDAEVLEHHISDRVLEAIDRICGHPNEDPHGHPIPDRHGHLETRRLRPLVSLAVGAQATVREIRDADGRRLARWKQAGLVPGARVRVRDVRALDGIFEVEVDKRTLVTGTEGLEGVMVEPRRSKSA